MNREGDEVGLPHTGTPLSSALRALWRWRCGRASPPKHTTDDTTHHPSPITSTTTATPPTCTRPHHISGASTHIVTIGEGVQLCEQAVQHLDDLRGLQLGRDGGEALDVAAQNGHVIHQLRHIGAALCKEVTRICKEAVNICKEIVNMRQVWAGTDGAGGLMVYNRGTG